MAIITNYTLGKLAKSFIGEEKITPEVFFREIYQDVRLFFFFNKFELNYIYNFKKFLEDELEFVKYFNKVPKEPDTETYVNEHSSHLTYHLDHKCKLLVKDFLGFRIPPEVKEAKKVKELREWFKENGFIKKYEDGEITSSRIIFKYNTSFAKKYQLKILNEDYNLVVEKNNSGNTIVDGVFDIEVFKQKVNNTVREIYNLISSEELERLARFDWLRRKGKNEINLKLIEAFGVSILNKYELEGLLSFWQKYYKLKMKIMALLLSYFKWTYKINEKEYDVITLEDFGMGLCLECMGNSWKDYLSPNNEIEEIEEI